MINFIGIHAFCCNELLESNIIYDVRKIEYDAITIEMIEKLYNVPSDFVIRDSMLQQVQQKISSEESIFVRVSSSYGCEILTLCKTIEMRKCGKTMLSP